MKKHIPNLLTSLNLFSGCIAAVMGFHGQYFLVVIWIVIAAVFDFSDGFAARLLKAYSPMGKELDSLADIVSFGVAPSVAIYSMFCEKMPLITHSVFLCHYFPFIGFLIAVFSGLRLAKFNIDERQSDSFIGLNVPANALFWSSICFGLMKYWNTPTPLSFAIISVFIILFGLLLVSELPMFSFKIKTLRWSSNQYRYILILLCIISLLVLGILGIASTILCYIILSLLNNKCKASA